MCAGGGGTGGGGTGQAAGYSPWMGYGGGMGQQSPMGSGALQSAGMGMGGPMQRQSPYMGTGGPQQSQMAKVDPFYTPGVAPPIPNQSQMGKVDRFAGLGGAPMPTGDTFSQQQAYTGGDAQAQLMGAQGGYNGAMQAGPGQMSQTYGNPQDQLMSAQSGWMQQGAQRPLDLPNQALQRAMSGYQMQGPMGSFSSAGTPYGMPPQTFGGGGSGQQRAMDLQASPMGSALTQQGQMNPNFQQLMAALQGMGGRQV